MLKLQAPHHSSPVVDLLEVGHPVRKGGRQRGRRRREWRRRRGYGFRSWRAVGCIGRRVCIMWRANQGAAALALWPPPSRGHTPLLGAPAGAWEHDQCGRTRARRARASIAPSGAQQASSAQHGNGGWEARHPRDRPPTAAHCTGIWARQPACAQEFEARPAAALLGERLQRRLLFEAAHIPLHCPPA